MVCGHGLQRAKRDMDERRRLQSTSDQSSCGGLNGRRVWHTMPTVGVGSMRMGEFVYFMRYVPASVFIVALGCGPTLSHYRDATHTATCQAAVVTSVCAITADPLSF